MPKHPLADGSYLVRGLPLHALSVVALLGIAWLAADFERTGQRTFLGATDRAWFVASLGIPLLHQVYVWLSWRLELCYRSLSQFGPAGLRGYFMLFFLLFLLRPVTLVGLAIVDHDSLALSIPLRLVLTVCLGAPALYTGYSVVRYFGLVRAAGADHFDARYRELPLVREGIFKYTRNSMYSFAFLTLWVIGVIAASRLTLVSAAFQHAYIWVHYFCTERPDMRLIYGSVDTE